MSTVPVDMQTTFPFRAIMDGLETVGKQIGQERLIVYRWRPLVAQLEQGKGALYHVLGDTPHTPYDVYHEEDNLLINTRIAVQHSEVPDEMALLEQLCAEYVTRIDPALKRIHPIGATVCKKAWRVSMRMVPEDFNGIPALCVEFPIVFTLIRQVVPNQ